MNLELAKLTKAQRRIMRSLTEEFAELGIIASGLSLSQGNLANEMRNLKEKGLVVLGRRKPTRKTTNVKTVMVARAVKKEKIEFKNILSHQRWSI